MPKPMQKPGEGVRPASREQIDAAHEKQRKQAQQKATLRKIEREIRERATDGPRPRNT